jgi:peptide/nickel transport system substrate-binding protein
MVLLGCAPIGQPAAEPARPGQAIAPQPTAQPSVPKRVTIAILSEPRTLYARSTPAAAGFPGLTELQGLVASGLVVANDDILQPQLSEAVPSVENGLWKLLPDGRMEITAKIRSGARWHDGTPFTSDDLLFTYQVVTDRELPSFRDSAYDMIESVEAPDAGTVVVRWKGPFIRADAMWSGELALPLPRHLLGPAYTERKDTFTNQPYWLDEFVGTGAYKVRDVALGSHVVLDAFDGYALGRPRIDTVEVRFIPDSNALVANILAGEVELTMSRTLSLDQGLQVRERWQQGTVQFKPFSAHFVHGQFINPDPPIVANPEFRRALLYAMDRQEIIDTFQAGQTTVAHAYVRPGSAEERELEASAVRYDYDPGRATRMIEGLGYSKGSDGFFRDAAGQRLSVEIRTTATEDIQVKEMSAVASYWQRIGVGVESLLISQQRNQDRADRSTRPAFLVASGGGHMDTLQRNFGRDASLPENNYAGGNFPRYQNSEYDALYERFLTTIPRADRMRVAGQMLRHLTTELPAMLIMYTVQTTPIANRLVNVTGTPASWHAHEWDVR